MKTTCKDCSRTWGGLKAEHCTACRETFSGITAGDKHRRGEYPNRTCSTEGLVFNAKRGIWQLPGTWAEHLGETAGAPDRGEIGNLVHREDSEPPTGEIERTDS